MNREERIKELQKAYNNLLPQAKSWNKDRLLLSWGFLSAIFVTIGIDLAKYLANNLSFNPSFNFILKPDFWVILTFFIFGLFGVIISGKIIDKNTDDRNRTLEVLKKRNRDLKNS